MIGTALRDSTIAGKTTIAPKLRHRLWQIRVAHALWTCDLVDYRPKGNRVQLFRDTQLFAGRRFENQALAEQWAELERNRLEA